MAPWRVSLLAWSLLALGLQAASGLQLPCGKASAVTGAAVVLRGGRFAFEEGGTGPSHASHAPLGLGLT